MQKKFSKLQKQSSCLNKAQVKLKTRNHLRTTVQQTTSLLLNSRERLKLLQAILSYTHTQLTIQIQALVYENNKNTFTDELSKL